MEGTQDVVIRHATAADAKSIADIHYDALQLYHDFYAAFLAVHPRISLPKSTARALANPRASILVAQSKTTLEIIGFVRYHVENPTGTSAKAQASANTQPENTGASLFAAKDHLSELWEQLQDTEAPIKECYEQISKDQTHAYIYHLMVSPSHQRRGIGKLLLGEVLSTADHKSFPTFIVSSRESHNLYLKLGFQDLAYRHIDNGTWAKEVYRIEQQLGNSACDELPKKYSGVVEDEHLMVRWPIRDQD